MAFPFGDWQFWTVTAAAAGAVWVLVRPFLARTPDAAPGPCGSCPSASGGGCGTAAPERRERLVVLRGGR